jgi:hypothetical protein
MVLEVHDKRSLLSILEIRCERLRGQGNTGPIEGTTIRVVGRIDRAAYDELVDTSWRSA